MKRITAYIIVIVCVVALSACSMAVPFFPPPTATPTSTPIPSPTSTPTPSFHGTLILRTRVDNEEGIYRLTYNADTWTTTPAPVIEGVLGTILSPDGRHLFVYQDETSAEKVIDLLTGQEVTFEIPEDLGKMTSISLSPDGTAFCYTNDLGKIYLYNIALGRSWSLHKAPSANYTFENGSHSTVYGDASCGLWLTPDRFVMYRYVGSMPRQVTYPGYAEVETNVTTIVTIGEKPKFEDVKQWFLVEAVSADGPSIVYTDKQNESIYVVRNFSSFKDMDPQPLAADILGTDTSFTFLPNDQLLYKISIDYSLVDLADMKIREWDLPNDCGNGQEYANGVSEGWYVDAYHSSWKWIGEPGSNSIACVYYPGVGDLSEIYVADLATGSITSIYTWEDPDGFGDPLEIIGWFPGDD